MSPITNPAAPPKRRRYQYSLRLLLVYMAVAVLCSKAKAEDAFDQGKQAIVEKNYDLAIRCFTEAIRLDPQNANAYIFRGLAYSDTGDQDKAIADCTEAFRIKPDFGPAFDTRGKAYLKRGETEKAEADFAEAKRLGLGVVKPKN